MYKATPPLHPVEGFNRALCCECGELRLMRSTYRGRGKNHVPECCSELGRMLVDLPCKHCKALTRHAYLRDHDQHADFAETLNRRTTLIA